MKLVGMLGTLGRGCWPIAMPLHAEENTEQKRELFVTIVIPLQYPIIGAREDHDCKFLLQVFSLILSDFLNKYCFGLEAWVGG